MNEQLLTCEQTFSLKPETLEKPIMEYYQETQNSSLTIKYILAYVFASNLAHKNSPTS